MYPPYHLLLMIDILKKAPCYRGQSARCSQVHIRLEIQISCLFRRPHTATVSNIFLQSALILEKYGECHVTSSVFEVHQNSENIPIATVLSATRIGISNHWPAPAVIHCHVTSTVIEAHQSSARKKESHWIICDKCQVQDHGTASVIRKEYVER